LQSNTTEHLGVAHGDDLFLIFNNRKSLSSYSEEERRLGHDFVEMYAMFSKNNEVNFGNIKIDEAKENDVQCIEVISSTNYSMKSLHDEFGEQQFWESLNIAE
jgi:hypothetical protein